MQEELAKLKEQVKAQDSKYSHLEQKVKILETHLDHQAKLTESCLKRCTSGSELVNLVTPAIEQKLTAATSLLKTEIDSQKLIFDAFNQTITDDRENYKSGLGNSLH